MICSGQSKDLTTNLDGNHPGRDIIQQCPSPSLVKYVPPTQQKHTLPTWGRIAWSGSAPADWRPGTGWRARRCRAAPARHTRWPGSARAPACTSASCSQPAPLHPPSAAHTLCHGIPSSGHKPPRCCWSLQRQPSPLRCHLDKHCLHLPYREMLLHGSAASSG